jgi:hypothetical protein
VNLTGRTLDLFSSEQDEGPTLSIPPEPGSPRVVIPTTETQICTYSGIPLTRERWGELPAEMPEPQYGVLYVVTQPVAMALWARGRVDVARPGRPIFRERDGRRDQVGVVGLSLGQDLA